MVQLVAKYVLSAINRQNFSYMIGVSFSSTLCKNTCLLQNDETCLNLSK